MKIVNSWNDFDPLKHCIVGIADNACIPPAEPAFKPDIPADGPMGGKPGLRPLETIYKANEQLDNLTKVLEKNGVKVDRPEPIQWNQAVVTPHFMTGSQTGCMPPRDVLLTIGSDIICTSMSNRSRYFEHYAYSKNLRSYFDQDPEFKWIYSPRPELSDLSFDVSYYDDSVTNEILLQRSAKNYFVTQEYEILFDAADVLRLGKDLFIQQSSTTNKKAMEWLRRMYPNLRIHCINFPTEPVPKHIDATFVPLKPGLILNNPKRPLPKEQRKIFEANDWEIVVAAPAVHKKPPQLCFSSVWLSMNMLVLDHNTVLVEASETAQQEQLNKLGMNVIPIPFRDAYPFGGGLHCATADVYREGNCEDYFPNQVEDPTLIGFIQK